MSIGVAGMMYDRISFLEVSYWRETVSMHAVASKMRLSFAVSSISSKSQWRILSVEERLRNGKWIVMIGVQ